MKLGVSYPQREVAGDPGAVRRFVKAAEDLGYEYMTAADHVVKATHDRREPPLKGPYTEKIVRSSQKAKADQVRGSHRLAARVGALRLTFSFPCSNPSDRRSARRGAASLAEVRIQDSQRAGS